MTGTVALITGAASGIGRAVSLRLVADGMVVVGVDADAGGLADTAAAAGERFHAVPGDLRDPAVCRAAVAGCVERHGRLDVLGNVAGVSIASHVTEVSLEDYRRMMAVNVDASFFLCQHAIPHLLETAGSIVNIASNAGVMGQAYTVVYSMTKAAVIALTKSLAMEFLTSPLRVNAIAPGMVNTPLVAGFRLPEDADWNLVGRYVSPRPAAEPEEVAELFAYLVSERARSVHGAIWPIDNGLTAG